MRYARRIARNPAKYFKAAFWRTLWPPVKQRTRPALVYGLPYLLRSLWLRPQSVYVFPSPMDKYQWAETYVAWKVFAVCNLRVSRTDPHRARIAIAWNPTTIYELDHARAADLPPGTRILNERCTDISKSRVGEVFHSVFGYRLEIDPLNYAGTILRKSERNGAHDATLQQGPLTVTEPGFLYQRLISWERDGFMVELRVFVVGGKAVKAYEAFRPAGNRFVPNAVRVSIVPLERALSDVERQNIAEFCTRMGLDFGALDILRDGPAGRIYIADCNNTPTGPAASLSVLTHARFVRDLAQAFKREYL